MSTGLQTPAAAAHRMQSVAGDPGRTRTCNPRSRNPLLYPVELRDRLAIAADRGTAAAVVIAQLYEKCAFWPRLSDPDFVPRRHSGGEGASTPSLSRHGTAGQPVRYRRSP